MCGRAPLLPWASSTREPPCGWTCVTAPASTATASATGPSPPGARSALPAQAYVYLQHASTCPPGATSAIALYQCLQQIVCSQCTVIQCAWHGRGCVHQLCRSYARHYAQLDPTLLSQQTICMSRRPTPCSYANFSPPDMPPRICVNIGQLCNICIDSTGAHAFCERSCKLSFMHACYQGAVYCSRPCGSAK